MGLRFFLLLDLLSALFGGGNVIRFRLSFATHVYCQEDTFIFDSFAVFS